MCMGVSTLKERMKEEILIYGLLQLSSLIYHAVPVHTTITPWQGASLPLYADGHSSSCLGNKLCALLRHPANPSNPLSHSYSQRPDSQICADEYLLSQPIRQLFNSHFIDRTLYLSANLFFLVLELVSKRMQSFRLKMLLREDYTHN